MKKNKISIIGLTGESNFMKVDHFNEEGETVFCDKYHKEYGGKGYNQAVAAARFGVNVDFFTILGDDDIAKKAINLLEKENINVFKVIKNNDSSANATILIDKEGRNRVICYSGVSNSLNATDITIFEESIKTSKILLLQLELPYDFLIKAISLALKYDTKIVLNPAPAYKLSNELLEKCYLITPNEHEIKILCDLNNDYTIDDLKNINLDNLVITLGSNGSIIKYKGIFKKIEANKCQVVNSCGAGDTYNGILCAALLCDYSLIEAAHLASIGATLSVQKDYVIDSIPYFEEIMKLYTKKNIEDD